jgi:hypothetical protein
VKLILPLYQYVHFVRFVLNERFKSCICPYNYSYGSPTASVVHETPIMWMSSSFQANDVHTLINCCDRYERSSTGIHCRVPGRTVSHKSTCGITSTYVRLPQWDSKSLTRAVTTQQYPSLRGIVCMFRVNHPLTMSAKTTKPRDWRLYVNICSLAQHATVCAVEDAVPPTPRITFLRYQLAVHAIVGRRWA